MAKLNWVVPVDDTTYNIEYIQKTFSKTLTINGTQVNFEKSKTAGLSSETHLKLGRKEAVFVINGRNIDLAVDGVYLRSGKPYIPLGPMPSWNWVFVILNGLVFLGFGLLPALLAFLGMGFCTKISLSKKIPLFVRILLCIIITLCNYFVFYTIWRLASSARTHY